jgi:hypothetical protein
MIVSRNRLEKDGEVFGCAFCGEVLPPVEEGHTSDFCQSCEAELQEEAA